MKVIHVINSLGPGGAEAHLVRVLEHLTASHPSDEHVVIEMVALMPRRELPGAVRMVPGPRSRVLGFASTPVRVVREYWRGRGVIVAWMYHACIASAMARTLLLWKAPIVLNIRHGCLKSISGSLRIVMVILSRFRLPTVFNSVTAMSQHAESGYVVKGAINIPNGIGPSVRNARTDEAGPVIGYIGRHHRDKGSDLLLPLVAPLLARNPHLKLRVIGQGTEALSPEVNRHASEFGFSVEQVEIFGHRTDPWRSVGGITVLVVPSRTEGFPNVAIEAMAQGIPIAFRRVGDLEACLSPILRGADDDIELRCELERLLQLGADERRMLGGALKARVAERYTIDATADSHYRLWSSYARAGT